MPSYLTGCKTSGKDKEKPIVYTSFYPVYSLAKEVFGDTVDLRIFMPLSQDPHLWEPSPKKMKELAKADLLIINGANLEKWADKIPQLLPDLEILDLAGGVNLISYKGAAAIGDFQYLAKADLTKQEYKIEFGHTHEKSLRMAFVPYDENFSEKEMIKIGREIMESEGEVVAQEDVIKVEKIRSMPLRWAMSRERFSLNFPRRASG